MFAGSIRNGTLDRLGIALSGLCLVHCIASAVLVAVLASAGGALLDHRIHAVGLVLAILLGLVALGRGIAEHGFMMPAAIGGGEVLYTLAGVAILALGHDLNRRAVI
jgi:hypothetical protein